jgi:hypothetical protein
VSQVDRRAEIARRYHEFAIDCRANGLPLYAALSDAVVERPELLDLTDGAARGQARPVLLLAAVQRLLFEAPEDPLIEWYPSLSGHALPEGDPVPDFLAFTAAHHDELASLIACRATQTNEVNRSVAVAACLRAATRGLRDAPIALVELGPSAGLNLRADTYAIDVGDGRLHQHASSPVVLATELRGPCRPEFDSPLPPIVDRVGLDLRPIDVTRDLDELLWLEACLWPEQAARVGRFRAAVEACREDPPRLVRGDLLDDLPAVLDGLAEGAHAVVFHSWVLTYVARDRRPGIWEILRHAAADRPLTWLAFEAAGVVPGLAEGEEPDGGGTTLLVRTTFRESEERSRVLARSHPHLNWLEWRC